MANPWEKYSAQETSSGPWSKYSEDEPAAKEDSGLMSDIGKYASKDPLLGAAENLASIATSAILEPIAGWAGIASSLFGDSDGGKSAADAVKSVQGAAYKPKTEAGAEIQQGLGEALKPVGEAIGGAEDFLGKGTLELTGSPALAAGAATIPTAALEALGLGTARKVKQAVPEQILTDKQGRFEDTGVSRTLGEETADTAQGFEQLKLENQLAEQSSEAGEMMRNQKLKQSNEVKSYLEGVTDAESGSVGDTVKKALELRKNSAKYKRKQAYDKLAEVTKDMDVALGSESITSKMPEAGDLRDFAASKPEQFKAISGLLSEFGLDASEASIARMKRGDIEITPLSVANAERFRKRLNNIEAADQTGSTSRITGPLKDALDAEFDLASRALEVNGSPSVSKAAKEARQSHIALKTEFDEKGIIDQLTRTKGRQSSIQNVESSNVYSKVISPSTSIEQVNKLVKSLGRAGSKGKAAINTMRAEVMLDLIDSGFNAASRKIKGQRTFGANAFGKRFDKLEPKLKAILSPKEFSKLTHMRKNAEDLIPPSGAVPKGSAGFFIDSLEKMGVWSLVNSVPTIGPIITSEFKRLGRQAGDAKFVDKAIKNERAKESLTMLQSNYPSLAAALGVGQLKSDDDPERDKADTKGKTKTKKAKE